MVEYSAAQLHEIDGLVAQHVMHWPVKRGDALSVFPQDGRDGVPWQPTRDRGQAMLVLESLCDDEIVLGPGESGGFFVGTIDWWSEDVSVTSEANTLPLAICLAALDWAEVKIPA